MTLQERITEMECLPNSIKCRTWLSGAASWGECHTEHILVAQNQLPENTYGFFFKDLPIWEDIFTLFLSSISCKEIIFLWSLRRDHISWGNKPRAERKFKPTEISEHKEWVAREVTETKHTTNVVDNTYRIAISREVWGWRKAVRGTGSQV